MIKIGIIDDHLLILNGLEHMLIDQADCRILFALDNGTSLFNALAKQLPDVLLLDIELPSRNGIDLCSDILKNYPSVKIIALTNHDEVVYVRKMMRAGALGYLLKGTDKSNLLEAIKTVYAGKQFLDRPIEQAILQQTITGKKKSAQVKLTNRENEILALIANEYTNQEIADKLFLSIRTVETHRNSLNHKLNIKNSAGLVKEAILRGLIK